MLLQLQIENVAVIEKAIIEFTEGFNALTGETGAGKSIIIDSINAVLGEKTSKDIIRTGAQKAKISAVFCDIGNSAESCLGEIGVEPSEDGMLILSRELSLDSRGSFRINGTIVPLMLVKQLAPYLINIHGQHDNQQLFSPAKHINFIDGFAGILEDVSKYKLLYNKVCDLKASLNSIETNDELKERKKELLLFQIEEIESAKLVSGEEEELLSRRDVIRNSEELLQNVSAAHELLVGNDESNGIVSGLNELTDLISYISEYDSDFSEAYEKISNISFEMDELLSEIRNAEGKYDFNPEELDQIEERLDIIFKLKKKYGNTVEDVIKKLDELKKEYDDIENSDENIEKMKRELEVASKEALALAENISQKRTAASDMLCEKIKNELAFLDMPNVSFAVSCEKTDLKPDGIDKMEFLISANKGETLRPLSKIASGGELSRIMLAIKTVLTESDQTETLIFDEIDTGVSGKTARKIGEKMKEISSHKQVLCVTHLAQIASLADAHLFIEKKTQENRTFTSVKILDCDERIYEIARIMSGEVITQAVLDAARELINV